MDQPSPISANRTWDCLDFWEAPSAAVGIYVDAAFCRYDIVSAFLQGLDPDVEVALLSDNAMTEAMGRHAQRAGLTTTGPQPHLCEIIVFSDRHMVPPTQFEGDDMLCPVTMWWSIYGGTEVRH